MSDVTLLRTLTRKSLMRFGKHPFRTVADVLIIDRMELVLEYYRNEAITFTEDILDELRLTPDRRIAKPGKIPRDQRLPEHFDAIRSEIKNEMTPEERLHMHHYHKSFGKKLERGLTQKSYAGRAVLQRWNHGHK